MNDALEPYTPHFDDDAIDDARQRLAQTRFPEAETVEDWQQGVPLSYCQELVRYWQDEYDWQRVPNSCRSIRTGSLSWMGSMSTWSMCAARIPMPSRC